MIEIVKFQNGMFGVRRPDPHSCSGFVFLCNYQHIRWYVTNSQPEKYEFATERAAREALAAWEEVMRVLWGDPGTPVGQGCLRDTYGKEDAA